jgi:DNA-binding transcriptional LysR family regulator
MNLRSVDLNLLVVLDVLLDEAHVTRAADRLALSQPAASSALERCRQLFDDLLLVRNGARMTLTPKAQALRAPVKLALQSVCSVLAPPEVDLRSLQATVHIGMADALVAGVVGQMQARLQATAPQICLAYHPWQGGGGMVRQLDQGELDLVVSVQPPTAPRLRQVALLQEDYRVAMRSGHPAADGFNLERWLAHPHVVVSSRGETHGVLDDALHRLGRSRRIGVVVPSFLLALSLIEQSDLVGLLPRRATLAASHRGLVFFEPPVSVDGFGLHLVWHARRDGDLAVQHVAGLLRETLGSA